jgi:uncharacterized membrane protein YkvA (DUF1232 family)
MLVGLLVRAEQRRLRQYMATKVFEAVQHFEHKYGEKTAAWAIVAMVVYLVIAQ